MVLKAVCKSCLFTKNISPIEDSIELTVNDPLSANYFPINKREKSKHLLPSEKICFDENKSDYTHEIPDCKVDSKPSE